MKGRMNTGLGEIVINPDVIALYGSIAAVECFGIVGMATGKHERWTGQTSEKRESATTELMCRFRKIKFPSDFHVIVSYGVSISAVTDNLINNVKYKVEEFTGMEIEKSTSWLKAFASSTDGNRRK